MSAALVAAAKPTTIVDWTVLQGEMVESHSASGPGLPRREMGEPMSTDPSVRSG